MNFNTHFTNTDFLVSSQTTQAQQNSYNAIYNFFDAKNQNNFFFNIQNTQTTQNISLNPTRTSTESTSVATNTPQAQNDSQFDENSSFSDAFTPNKDEKQPILSNGISEVKSTTPGSLDNDEASPENDFEDFINVEDDEEREMLISKGWKVSDDQTLLTLATKYKCDWKKISKKFDNKKFTPYFLKIRYKELIDAPVQKKHKFTLAEDLLLAKLFKTLGSNWNEIAKNFKNRTGVMLKNRYYSYIRKRGLLDELVSKADGNVQQVSQDKVGQVEKPTSFENKPAQETYLEKKEELKVMDLSEVCFSHNTFEYEGFRGFDELHTKITPMEYDDSFFIDYAGPNNQMNYAQGMNYGYGYNEYRFF